MTGPSLDIGPAGLINLLGPVRRVTGITSTPFTERTIKSEKKRGQTMAVEVPTHVAGVLEFVQGAVVTLVTSFDVQAHNCPRIEIYGSEGSLKVPDPNGFGGTVELYRDGL